MNTAPVGPFRGWARLETGLGLDFGHDVVDFWVEGQAFRTHEDIVEVQVEKVSIDRGNDKDAVEVPWEMLSEGAQHQIEIEMDRHAREDARWEVEE